MPHAIPDPLLPLGLDFLTFLAATVLVIPVFKSVKASPILGFLFSGLVLGQLGCAIHNTSQESAQGSLFITQPQDMLTRAYHCLPGLVQRHI